LPMDQTLLGILLCGKKAVKIEQLNFTTQGRTGH